MANSLRNLCTMASSQHDFTWLWHLIIHASHSLMFSIFKQPIQRMKKMVGYFKTSPYFPPLCCYGYTYSLRNLYNGLTQHDFTWLWHVIIHTSHSLMFSIFKQPIQRMKKMVGYFKTSPYFPPLCCYGYTVWGTCTMASSQHDFAWLWHLIIHASHSHRVVPIARHLRNTDMFAATSFCKLSDSANYQRTIVRFT